MALFDGLGMFRLVDPASVTNETLDIALALLYESMGGDTPQSDGAPGDTLMIRDRGVAQW